MSQVPPAKFCHPSEMVGSCVALAALGFVVGWYRGFGGTCLPATH